MLVEKIWRKSTYGMIEAEYRGWFLLGIIPLYIKIIKL